MITDFTRYPREFITYKWYRPVLTAILFFVFYLILGGLLFVGIGAAQGASIGRVIEIATGGYDSMDVYTTTGAIVSMGSIALMIPALALANLIAGKRTFRSYTSSRGGWDYGIFFKSLLIAFFVCAVPIAIDNIFHYGRMSANKFTLAGFIFLTILGPFQCIAEEYAFRSLIMQAVGSWFRFAPLTILVSSAVFAAMHPYNTLGVVNIFIDGCCFCLIAWLTRGIEASSALHIANNMTIFYTVGLGFGVVTSQTTMSDFILSVSIDIVFLIAVMICRKRGMFDKVKMNDAAEYNAKVEAKRAQKAAKKTGHDKAVFEDPDPEKEK